MNTTVTIGTKPIDVELSDAAAAALAQRDAPLLAEMELLFSCLIRKKVRFLDAAPEDSIRVTDRLALRFHPVMTQQCRVTSLGDDKPPLTDFPITNPQAFVPHWLRIDYRAGQWLGEFGYHREAAVRH